MARYLLSGGPCNGQQSINFTVKPYVGYTVECSRTTYRFGADNVFHVVGPVTGIDSGYDSAQHQLDQAWRGLMRAYAVTLKRALDRSAAGRRRMKRAVR